MSEVSVVGLGAMGSALARALRRDGHRVTVWNRTGAKAEPLVRDGALLAHSPAAAVSASPRAGEVIQTGTFDRPQSSVKTCTVAFELFVKHAREARINAEFPTFGLGLFKTAMAAGYREEEVAALIKVLRGGA
jgi:3-hydroxyisobutyrate dehydrogenase-like beta-hydroxyacid dehydrogenase